MRALQSMALGFGLLFATAAVNAQGVNVRADIPVPFVVDRQILPAGEYDFRPGAASYAILMIQSADGKKTTSSTTNACGGGDSAKNTELVFHHVGRRYFLSQILVQGYPEGRQLPKSRAEAEMELNQRADNVVIFAEIAN